MIIVKSLGSARGQDYSCVVGGNQYKIVVSIFSLYIFLSLCSLRNPLHQTPSSNLHPLDSDHVLNTQKKKLKKSNTIYLPSCVFLTFTTDASKARYTCKSTIIVLGFSIVLVMP